MRLYWLLFVVLANSTLASEYTIGLAVWSGYPQSVQGFKDGLAEQGLNEGEQVTFIEGDVGADKDLQIQVANRFKSAKVDLVYSLTTPGTTILKEIMNSYTPIVFSIVTYPADSGLIESFEYSGNNLVGTSNYVSAHQYMRLLKLVMPSAKRVAIFHRMGEPNSKIQAVNMYRLLRREGIEVFDREPENFEQLTAMANELVGKVDVFMTTTDTLMQSGGEDILIELSLQHNIPILSSNKKGIENGSAFGPVADFYTLGKMSGYKAAKILKDGVPPRRLMSEVQDPPLYLVNRATVQALQLKLSESALRAVSWIGE